MSFRTAAGTKLALCRHLNHLFLFDTQAGNSNLAFDVFNELWESVRYLVWGLMFRLLDRAHVCAQRAFNPDFAKKTSHAHGSCRDLCITLANNGRASERSHERPK